MEAFRRGGQVAQIVGFIAVRERTEIFAAVAAGDCHASNSPLFCQSHTFPLGKDTAIGQFIAGYFAVFADQAGDGLCVLVGNRVHDVDVGR